MYINKNNIEEKVNDKMITLLDTSTILTSYYAHIIIPVFITDISENIKNSRKNNDK